MRAIVLLTTLFATAVAADTTLSYTAAGSSDPVMTLSASGGRVRIDEIAAGSSVIIDPAAGTLIAINHQQRSYMLMDEAFAERTNQTLTDAQAQMERALANVPAAQRDMVRRMMQAQQGGNVAQATQAAVPHEISNLDTGTSGSYGGYACRVMETRLDGTPKSRACLAQPAAVGVSASDFAMIRSAFEFALEYSRRMTTGVDMVPQMQFPPMDGVMVQQRELPTGPERVISGVDSKGIPADRFQPPAGYSQQDPTANVSGG